MGIGVLLGGLLGAATGRRLGVEVVRGPRIGVSGRLAGALIGGLLMGAAARLSLGCTSGQALSGGSLQSVGAWAFMFSVFGGGYAVALLVKKEWT